MLVRFRFLLLASFAVALQWGCVSVRNMNEQSSKLFPAALVAFSPHGADPVFTGGGPNAWDRQIRERGYVLKEKGMYHLWYTGYSPASPTKFLGYATSNDGINWKRFQDKTLYEEGWVEDMCVVKFRNAYYMFAEGRGDTAHLLVSDDKIHWKSQGDLDIRKMNGSPISPGAFGTPTVIHDKGFWYLFYEREDKGVWLARSKDLKVWTNVDDEPVLKMGPDPYDAHAVAMNQVIKYNGLYYGYYHASAFKDWHEWSVNIAVSKDLIHWKKFEGNPIIGNNKSSGIVVKDKIGFRLYTMHRRVDLFLNARQDSVRVIQ